MVVKTTIASVFLGSGVGLLTAVGLPAAVLVRAAITGAIIGFTIAAWAWIFDALSPCIQDRIPAPWGMIAFGIRFVIAGFVGWVTGYPLAVAAAYRRAPSFEGMGANVVWGIAVSCSLAIVVGFLAETYDRMQRKLRAQVGQLKEREFAEKELQLARSIQSRLLPPPEIEGHGYRVSARNLAAGYVAGDFYDVFHLADGSVGIVVGDVAGKGVAASLIMASVKAMLPLLAANGSVETTMRALNSRLHAQFAKRDFVALAFARLDSATGALRLTNAGIPDPYLVRAGVAVPLAVTGPRLPLGMKERIDYEAADLQMSPGDRLVLFSDGLPEAPTSSGEPLGYEALARLLPPPGLSSSEYADALVDAVRRVTAATLEDDWTVLVLEKT